MVLADGRWRGASTAEKRLIRDRLARTCAQRGIPVPQSVDPARDTPGELAVSLDPVRLVQRAHLRAIDEALRWVYETPHAALMIWTPPQVGKSWRVSRWFPFWWLTHRPADRILLASYAEPLARAHAMATRTLIEQYGAGLGLLVNPVESAASDWSLLSLGGMRARGLGGGLTGHPGDLGLIDDPIKDRAAAESLTIRDAAWDWYSGVFTARLSPGAREIMTLTRWHPDDLAGRTLARDGRIEEGGRWRVLALPAFAVAEDLERGIGADPLGRAPGDPLPHPKIDEGDTEALRAHWTRKKSTVTARDWDAMYMCSPHAIAGAILTEAAIRERTARPPGEFVRVGVGIDPSGGGRDTAGIVAAGVGADGRTWILADRSAVMSSDAWPEAACLLAAATGATCFVVEKNYGGDQTTSLLRRAWNELRRKGKLLGPDGTALPRKTLCPRLIGVNSRMSKALRAEPVAQAVKSEDQGLWFAAGVDFKQLITEWTQWQPGSTWSPGALDACVHVATELIPDPEATTSVTSVAGRSKSAAGAGSGLAARRKA